MSGDDDFAELQLQRLFDAGDREAFQREYLRQIDEAAAWSARTNAIFIPTTDWAYFEQQKEQRQREEMEALDAQVNAVEEIADLLSRAALIVAGYRQHDRGQWRRKRGNADNRR